MSVNRLDSPRISKAHPKDSNKGNGKNREKRYIRDGKELLVEVAAEEERKRLTTINNNNVNEKLMKSHIKTMQDILIYINFLLKKCRSSIVTSFMSLRPSLMLTPGPKHMMEPSGKLGPAISLHKREILHLRKWISLKHLAMKKCTTTGKGSLKSSRNTLKN